MNLSAQPVDGVKVTGERVNAVGVLKATVNVPAVQSSPVRKGTSCLSAVREGYVGLKGYAFPSYFPSSPDSSPDYFSLLPFPAFLTFTPLRKYKAKQ